MSKNKMILLCSLLVAVFSASMVLAAGYIFPELSKEMTRAEKLNLTTVPDEILKTMRTSDLVETVMRHPFRFEFLIATMSADGLEASVRYSNCFQELECQHDSGKELMARHTKMDPKSVNPDFECRELVQVHADFSLIELLLAQGDITS